MRIGIIGKGNVGTALAQGLTRAGHQIKFGHRDPKEPVKAALEWGEVIILAIPHNATKEVVSNFHGMADGKPLIDVTNALDENSELLIGFDTSAAEEIQKMVPKVHVVKAFNTVFAKNQGNGHVGDKSLTAFLAGDNKKAKQIVMQLAKDIGFISVDCGPLKAARYLEPMAILIIDLAFDQNLGTDIGYKLIVK